MKPHSFQSVADLANSPEGDGGAASVSPAEAASFHEHSGVTSKTRDATLELGQPACDATADASPSRSFDGLANPIDPYERHRQDVLRYRKRRLDGEPFTLWDFQVFAEINSNDLTKDYQEEQWEDWTR